MTSPESNTDENQRMTNNSHFVCPPIIPKAEAATPAVGGEREALANKLAKIPLDQKHDTWPMTVRFRISETERYLLVNVLRAQPAPPLRGRDAFEAFVKRAGFTDWSRYGIGDGYARPLIDRMWSAWSASPPLRVTGASNLIEEAACLIWSELCPGMVMGDDDIPHYEAAAKAVLALSPASIAPDKET